MKRAIGKARMFKLICLLEDGIGIVGSPRKNGNVDTLVSRVLEGAREAGLDTSKYLLNEMKYSGCRSGERGAAGDGTVCGGWRRRELE